jgi:hypothetical protein
MGNTKTEAPRIVPAKPTAEMAERDDVTTCGICSEPFRNGDVAVQAARWAGNAFVGPHVSAKFWAHPVCLFSIARETEGPASRVAAMPPEPPDDGDEASPDKRKPK